MRALSPPVPPPKGAVYAAVFLDEPSRRRLVAAFPAAHPQVFAEHVTLAFGKDLRPDGYPVGEPRRLIVTGYAVDARGQAVVVAAESIADLMVTGRIPHVTISTAAGTKPVYSNTLVAGPLQPVTRRIELTGTVDYFPRSSP